MRLPPAGSIRILCKRSNKDFLRQERFRLLSVVEEALNVAQVEEGP